MKTYSELTKAELIERLQALETGAGPIASPTSASDAIKALHDSEERLRAILQTAVEGIITIDEHGMVESINPAAERIFGYSATEVLGRNVSLLMPSPVREEHDRYLADYLRTGQAHIIGIGREVLGQRKDGSLFAVDLAVSEVRLADRRLFTGFLRDLTDRKGAELRQAIQYGTARALAGATSLSEGAPRVMEAICQIMGWRYGEFWSVDPEAKVIHHVQSWYPAEIAPTELEQTAGRVFWARGRGVPGHVWDTGKPEWIIDLARTGDFLRAPEAVKDGLHGAVAFPILLGGEVLGVMVFFARSMDPPSTEWLDLFAAIGSQIGQFIERKRAEGRLAEVARSLAEKNKELETILYVASHDLRSPLVNIQGFSRELLRACQVVRERFDGAADCSVRAEVTPLLSQDIPEALDFILAGVKKIDGLLSGLLRFSRLGRAALRPEPLAMRSLIESIIRVMDFQIKQAGAAVELTELPDCVGDPLHVNQVFSNLLDNAIKYRDLKRKGKITISGELEGGRAVYAVSDNGIGIAAEHQAKVFEIFHRLNPSSGEGEGLGLAIAQRILERQGGRIWVSSRLGEGSTFYVSLPAGKNPER